MFFYNIELILLKKLKRISRNRKINDIQFLNKYFENMNKSLELNDVLQINVETYNVRRNKIINKYIYPLNYFLLFLDTIFVRIAPKLSLTKKLYFKITKGREGFCLKLKHLEDFTHVVLNWLKKNIKMIKFILHS